MVPVPVRVEVVECPRCGAPLHLRSETALTGCRYCRATLRITPLAGGSRRVEPDDAIAPADLEAIDGLVRAGRRDEAIDALQRLGGYETRSAAEAALHGVTVQVTLEASKRSLMSPRGWVVMALCLAGVVGGAALLASGSGAEVAGGVLVVVGGLLLAAALPIALRTLRYRSAVEAEAVLLHHVVVESRGDVHTLQAHLRVTEPAGPSFETELALRMRNASLQKALAAGRLRVKLFSGRPDTIVFVGDA